MAFASSLFSKDDFFSADVSDSNDAIEFSLKETPDLRISKK